MGVDLVLAVQDFFHTGQLLKQINATNISLVPKVTNPNIVADYRPISFCNVVYKVITKVMANRMQSILEDIISPTQGAFVQHRSIVSNILICQELVRNYHRTNSAARCLMKLDVRKAYDTVEHSFLRDVMLGLGFPNVFVHRMMTCITSAQFSIIINGVPHGYFRGRRGLQQGDPVSPYLFVIAMDHLSRKLLKLEDDRNFSYHLHCKGMKLKHLSFADDLMFICKADEYSPMAMKEIFEEFSVSSGLQINNEKSNVFVVGVPEETKRRIIQKLGFNKGKLPMHYLGVPLIATRLSVKDCSPIIQRVQQKIDGWMKMLLSLAGRVQLVNFVLFHISSFWCNVFILPIEVIGTIENCCRNFIWTGNWRNVGMPSISWEKMCHPRIEGGLGIKQLGVWNRAAMGKHLWTLMTKPENLWAVWMRNKLKGRSIWVISIPQDCSWAWRKILQLRGVMQQHFEVIVGDGRQCSLFFDKWLNGRSIADLVGSVEMVCQWGSVLNVSDWRCNGQWNIPMSFCRNYPEIADVISLVQCHEGKDRFVWRPVAGKGYSIAPCYEVMRSKRERVSWAAMVWNSSIMPRHSFVWWLVIHNRMKTRDLLRRRGMQISPNCCFCQEQESVSHLFFKFSFSNQIWKGVLLILGIHHTPREWELEWAWIQNRSKGRSRKKRNFRAVLAYTIYQVWIERNSRIFTDRHRDANQVMQEIDCYYRQFCEQ